MKVDDKIYTPTVCRENHPPNQPRYVFEFVLECGHGGTNSGCKHMLEKGHLCYFCKQVKKVILVRDIGQALKNGGH